ncbi:hypothetical protein SLS62_003230 [Diatrype stigma]|uniref:Uncharacterized protein n=1 Tax=Diatrype stigma TaxID=117547 RepID=A0AAN9V6Z7_9PEZI
MDSAKNIRITGRHGSQLIRSVNGRVYIASQSRRTKAKNLMKKPEWHSLPGDADLDLGFSRKKDIASNLKAEDSRTGNPELGQTRIVKKKSKEDGVNLYDIPEWPGSAEQVEIKRKRPAEPIETREVKRSKANRHREISLWDIPQFPAIHDGDAIPAGVSPFAREGTNPNIGNPRFGSQAFPRPSAFQYQSSIPRYDDYDDDDTYYYALLLRKQQLLLEMQICMQRQAIIDAGSRNFDFQAFMQDAADVKDEDN